MTKDISVTVDDLKKCKTLSECTKLVLGVDYYNGRTKKLLLDFCKELNFDIISYIEEKKVRHCNQCGKVLCGSQKKFCSSSCAATYNNIKRGKHSDETKKKISETLLLKKRDKDSIIERYSNGKIKKINNSTIPNKRKKEFLKVCCVCHKEFYSVKENTTHCSRKCVGADKEYKAHLRNKVLERVENGTHQGWKNRNITSYPEKFWITVLENNNIEYKREFYEKPYFLDFAIVKNNLTIDLEIDGKQHKYNDRKESDIKRDKFLNEKGYVVYRIEWNEINSEKGKKEMKSKIESFLNFYQNI